METGAAIDTRDVRRGLNRLAGDDGRPSKGDHRLYKIKNCFSRDGTRETVTIGLDCSCKEQHPRIMELIADQLHVSSDEVEDVLENWTPEQFRAHCATLSAEELKPPSMRRRF